MVCCWIKLKQLLGKFPLPFAAPLQLILRATYLDTFARELHAQQEYPVFGTTILMRYWLRV